MAGLNTPVCMADDHEQAHALLVAPATRQLALALDDDFYRQIGRRSPLAKGGVTGFIPEWLSGDELRAAVAAVPDPMLAHDQVIHGTPAEVAHQLRAYEQAGLEYFAPLDASSFTDMSQLARATPRLAELKSHLTHAGVA